MQGFFLVLRQVDRASDTTREKNHSTDVKFRPCGHQACKPTLLQLGGAWATVFADSILLLLLLPMPTNHASHLRAACCILLPVKLAVTAPVIVSHYVNEVMGCIPMPGCASQTSGAAPPGEPVACWASQRECESKGMFGTVRV